MREILVATGEEARGRMKHLLASAIVLGLILFAPQAYADPLPTLKFLVGATEFTCEDGDPTCDSNPVAGAVTYIGSLGSYIVNVTTGLTKPLLGGSEMDLNSVNIQGSGTDPLIMVFSETGFTLNGGAFASFGGTISSGATVQYLTYYDTGNALFGEGTQIADSLVQTGPAFSGTYYGAGPATGSYSMTQKLIINTSGPAVFSGNFAVGVPEPTGVVELLGALLLVTFGARRWAFRRS